VFTGAKAGITALRLAGDTAIAGAESSAISEAMLAQTTPHYTFKDAAINVGTSTLLSGLLGAGAGALLSHTERKSLLDGLHADREQWGAEVNQPNATGAAPSDTRKLEMDTILKGFPDLTAKVSPPRRVLNSIFLSARRAVADLVETPYIFKENAQGIATTQGPALSRLAKLEQDKARIGITQMFDRLYARYRFGHEAENLGERITQQASRVKEMVANSSGKASFPEFKTMVDEALRNSDQHAVPEVAEAAQFIRKSLITPWRDRAIKAGMLPEDVDVKTADSYFMRVWNKEKVIADRPGVQKLFADWLQNEEGKKIGIRDKLAGDFQQFSDYGDTAAKLEAQIARRTAELEQIGARQDETTRLNKQAFQRAEQMRENPAFGLEVLRTDAQRNNAKGGAVFESKIRDRGNALADRASARDAQILDLEQRLAAMNAKRDKLRSDMEEAIKTWEGNSSREAKAALKAREAAEKARAEAQAAGTYQGKGERLTSADAAIEKTIKRILAREPLSRQEHLSRADEIINRIVGSPDGRLPYDDASVKREGGVARDQELRGPLATRDFAIPDALIRDYLETDVHKVSDIFARSIIPDVLLTEKFGDINMTEVFRKLHDEAAAKQVAAKTEKERLAIQKQAAAVETDLAAMRDRIRHTYGFSSDPRQRFLGRVAATAARYDMITNLGGAALSSLADLAGAQWRYGFDRAFANAWRPMFKALVNPETRKALKQYGKQLRALGIAAETYTTTRTTALHDILDVYQPTSRFERATAMISDKFGLASLLTPWTDFGKFAAGMVSGSEITRAVEALSARKASARQIRDLAEGGIDYDMAGRIWQQMQAPGGSDVVDGIRIPNTGNWTDKGAANAFEGMLSRDVDLMVITPGQEKPLMMADPIKALILQYKTFVVAANERILVRSLQARDAQVLQGAVSAIGLGMLSEYAYSLIAGREPPKNTADWVKAGITRSGMLGWYQEGNSILAKWTGGSADAFRLMGASRPDARYISRSPGAALLGPVYGKFEAAIKAFSKITAKALNTDPNKPIEWTASDTRNLRRLLIGQNLFWLRGLLDRGEAQVNDALGVEQQQ
jgi:hypothetical protein